MALVLALLMLTPATWTTPASSQASIFSDPAAKQQSDELFQQVLKKPGDVELSLRHADAATAAGDLEAAIGSLERVLLFNPNLGSVRIELGVLYFRLGSYEQAYAHFEAANKAGGTPEQRSRADSYLAEIRKRLSPVSTTGRLQFGLRTETNANAGSSQALQSAFDPAVAARFTKTPDSAAFGSGLVNNYIDFGNQRGDMWETQLRGYGGAQRDLQYLNVASGEVQTGPRLALFPETLNGLSVRPYVGLAGINLGGSEYMSSKSTGATLTWMPEPGWLVEVGADRAWRTFFDSGNYPSASDETGTYDSAWLLLAGRLPLGLTWTARFTVADKSAQERFLSSLYRGLDVTLSYSFVSDVAGRQWRTTISPYAGIGTVKYDVADPDDPTGTIRHDLERRGGLYLETMFDDRWGLGVRAQYSQNLSTVKEFQYDNVLVLGGPVLKF